MMSGASVDTIMFNVVLDYLPEDEEVEVVLRTTAAASESVEAIFEPVERTIVDAAVAPILAAVQSVLHEVRTFGRVQHPAA